MKKIVLKNILSLLVFFIVLLTIIEIFQLDILPNKYLIIFLVSEIFLYGLCVLLYNLKKKVWIILGIIFFIITIIGNIGLYYYLDKTNKYMDNNFAIKSYFVKTKYYVIANTNNEINGVEELSKDTTIEYYKFSRAIDLAMKKLGKYQYHSTDNAYDTMLKVMNENKYFLISQADYTFILEASNEMDESYFKIINEFDVLEEKKMNEKTPEVFNVYINGLDYSGNRRDYNLIATINTKTQKVVLTSIPRDFYIDIPAYGMKDSLTALGTVDPEISKEALENLFDIKIDYMINLYTESLVKVVDTIGGVEFCSNSNFYTSHDMTLGSYDDYGEKLYVTRGCRTYNGLEALAIARERVHIKNGDRARQDNCRQILINVVKKLASITTLTNYEEVLNSFEGLYTTNINKKAITNLIKIGINNPNFEIIEQSVDGVDGKGTGRLGTGIVWTLEPKMDTVENASNKIKEIMNEK